MTHCTATYVVWFFPFVLLATLVGDKRQEIEKPLPNDESCATIRSALV